MPLKASRNQGLPRYTPSFPAWCDASWSHRRSISASRACLSVNCAKLRERARTAARGEWPERFGCAPAWASQRRYGCSRHLADVQPPPVTAQARQELQFGSPTARCARSVLVSARDKSRCAAAKVWLGAGHSFGSATVGSGSRMFYPHRKTRPIAKTYLASGLPFPEITPAAGRVSHDIGVSERGGKYRGRFRYEIVPAALNDSGRECQ